MTLADLRDGDRVFIDANIFNEPVKG